MVSGFKKLKVWQKAADFVVLIYEVSGRFPQREIYGLTSQIRRAGVSISGNIAEGSGKFSDAEFKRFLCISYGSVKEVETCLIMCDRLRYLGSGEFEILLNDCCEISKMLAGLIKYFENKK